MGGHREFERAVLGAPIVPPGRITNLANALRRSLAGAHRRSAPPPLQILEALFGQFDAPVLGALVDIGVPDELTSPRSVRDLAAATGTDPDQLERVLRYAAARGFVTITKTGEVGPNGVTRALRSDSVAPWHAWVQFISATWFSDAWRHLADGLRSPGESAFEHAHGHDFFTYITSVDPSAGAIFGEAMAAGATLQAIGLAKKLDWAGVTSVCDIGGGTGAALEVIQRYHPQLDVTLFDLAEVTSRARLGPRDTSPGRRRIESGNFFDIIPHDHDRYLLLAIIHDWDDDHAHAILSNVRAALPEHGRAIVVENMAPGRPRDDFTVASDLLMFVLAAGRERTDPEYRDLFAAAQLTVRKQHLLPTGATAYELTTE